MKANNNTEQIILDYFEKNASEDLKKRVEAENKTVAGALNYAASEAHKMQDSNRCVCVDDATVFGWVMHYFEDEDAKKWNEPKTSVNVATATPKTAKKNKKDTYATDALKVVKTVKKTADDAQLMLFPLEGV